MNIALGTAQFGNSYGIANKLKNKSIEVEKSILSCAFNAGISTLDTAIDYGESEKRLGMLGVKGWKIITKIPRIPSSVKNINEWVDIQIKGSLTRLNTNQIYAVLLHSPKQLVDFSGNEIFKALQNLKSIGLVKKIGISIYDPTELDLLFNLFDFDLVQTPLNVLDRRILKSGWLSKLSSNKIEVHARSIFLQGLLLMSRNQIPTQFNKWAFLWNKWHQWLADSNLTALDACLQFALSFKQINKVIIGVDNINQIKQIVKSTKYQDISIPDYFETNDVDLINPYNWEN